MGTKKSQQKIEGYALERMKANKLQAYQDESLIPFMDYQVLLDKARISGKAEDKIKASSARSRWLNIITLINKQFPMPYKG